MLNEFWELKEQAHTILLKEYEDHTSFSLSEKVYHGITTEFYWYNSTFNKLPDQFILSPQGNIHVKGTDVSVSGWGCSVEESITNLLDKLHTLTGNETIKELSIQANELLLKYEQT